MRAGLWPRSSRYECSRSSILVIWLKISTCAGGIVFVSSSLAQAQNMDKRASASGPNQADTAVHFRTRCTHTWSYGCHRQMCLRRHIARAWGPASGVCCLNESSAAHLVAAGVQAGQHAVQQRHLAALRDQLLRRRILQVVLVELRCHQVRVVGDLDNNTQNRLQLGLPRGLFAD